MRDYWKQRMNTDKVFIKSIFLMLNKYVVKLAEELWVWNAYFFSVGYLTQLFMLLYFSGVIHNKCSALKLLTKHWK